MQAFKICINPNMLLSYMQMGMIETVIYLQKSLTIIFGAKIYISYENQSLYSVHMSTICLTSYKTQITDFGNKTQKLISRVGACPNLPHLY